jgi:tRNA pseudouridine38-40 synthase
VNEAIFDCTGGVSKHKNRQVKTIFSGRTDKGVNALGQVIHFDSDKEIVASNFIYHVNEILPKDISVNNLRIVPESFHAQKSAKARYYRYELINRRYKQAFDGDILRVKYDLDIERMQNALNILLGEHDFSSFKSSGTLNPSKVCKLTKTEVEKQGDRVFIHIEGNRFLYNMVRTIVGTLLEIEGHKLPVEHMKEVLEAHDRKKAGQTVSPYGLTLIEVKY